MEHDENGLITSEPSGEVDREVRGRIETLLAKTSRVVSPDAQLYYFRIRFNEEYPQLTHRKRLLSEVDNALDIRSADPEIAEFSSVDAAIDLLLETRMDPESIVEALDHDCIDTVSHRNVDPDAFDLDVADTAKSDVCTVTAEFERLRQQYTDGGKETDLGEGTFEFTDPESLHFSEDEIGFDELVAASPGESGDGAQSRETAHRQSESLVGALVAELEGGVADADDVATLRDHLDRRQSTTSVAVRLDHVQSRMDSFAAYIDSLEEFLDEEGTGRQLLEELQADVDELRDELRSAAEEREALRTRVAELEADLRSTDELEAEVARVEHTLDTVSDELRQEVDELDARLETTEANLEDQIDWRRRLCAALSGTDTTAVADD